MASGDTGNVVPGNRLWVRVPCPPLGRLPGACGFRARERVASPLWMLAAAWLLVAGGPTAPPAVRAESPASPAAPQRSGATQPRSGTTSKFGSGTITRRSDGTTSETRPFGSGTITTERDRQGRSVTGQTQKFGSGTITRRSNGSSSTTQPFGGGTIQRDEPGRASGSAPRK